MREKVIVTAKNNSCYNIPESKLAALKPLLFALADESIVIERDLTDKERDLIKQGIAEHEDNPDSFIPLELVN